MLVSARRLSSYSKFSNKHRVFVTVVYSLLEHQYYHQAVEDPQWQDAMKDEIHTLERNTTLTLTTLSPSKWSLLVANGFTASNIKL